MAIPTIDRNVIRSGPTDTSDRVWGQMVRRKRAGRREQAAEDTTVEQHFEILACRRPCSGGDRKISYIRRQTAGQLVFRYLWSYLSGRTADIQIYESGDWEWGCRGDEAPAHQRADILTGIFEGGGGDGDG